MADKEKSLYRQLREEAGWSREIACMYLNGMAPERLERVENGRYPINPDEVLVMAEAYKAPELCNHYCANDCPIGQKYVPEIKIKDLSQIVLEMLASLNTLRKQQERLIEITADGEVEKSEIADFVKIQNDLEYISVTVDTLRLWAESMLADGKIDMDTYNYYKNK